MTEDPNKKNQTPPSDVLKKLKEVRRKLQESLSEGEEKATVKTPQEKLDIIPGATETLARAAAEKERARLEKEMAAAEKAAVPAAEAVAPQRQLYKAGGEETSEITAKKAKAQASKKPKITAARLASIQRRVRQKSSSVRTMGKGKRTALVIVLCFAFLPLVGSLQLNLIACEFKIDQFAINRDQNAPAGELSISLPVHNPQFIPAFLGQVSLKIYDPTTGNLVLEAGTVSTHMINPYDTITLTLKATLNPDFAGEWLKGLLTTKMLNIQIKDLSYSGLTVPNEIIPVISLDISSLFSDLLGSILDVEELLSGFLGDMVKTAERSTDDHIVRDLWFEAKTNAILAKAKATGIKDPSSAQFDDLLGSLGLEGLALDYVDVYETEKNFTVELTVGIELPGLEGMNLGPIIMSYLNASLWTNNVDDIKTDTHDDKAKYKAEVARLELLPSTIIGDRNTLKNHGVNNTVYGVATVNDGAYIVLDGTTQSQLSARLTIFKDTIAGNVHPSAAVNWDDAGEVLTFAELAKKNYPTWYFLYYLLANGSLDVFINVQQVDLEIFGIPIMDLPLDILDPIYLDGVLNISELFSPFGIGFGDGIAMFVSSVTTGGLALPSLLKSRYKIGPNARVHTAPITEDNLTDALESMIDLGALELDMSMIHESWGPDANLSLGIGIPLNNTLFNIHLGLVDTHIRLGTKLPDQGDDVDPTFFAILDLTSNGSNTIYLNGSTPPWGTTLINASLVILKNETMAPYAAVFLRKFIEEFTLDAYLNIHLGELVLFKENMTLKGIDLTLPLTFDLGDMVNDLVSGLIGDMISSLTESLVGSAPTNGTSALIDKALSNPLAAPYALPFLLTNPFAAVALGQPRSAQLEDIFGGDVGFTFGVESNPVFTSIDLAISGLSIDMADLGIPVSIGLGYSSFEILGAVPNQFGGIDWNNMLELKLDNYIDLASTEPQSIIAHLRIYESIFTGGAICNFLDEMLENGTLTMKLSGNTALNLSGIFLDDLDMSLELNKVETGLNITELINGLIGSLTGSAGEPAIDWGPVPAWWTGDASSLPFMQPLTAQAGGTTDLMGMLDMFVSINTDMLSIDEITETDWPYKNNESLGGTHTGKVHLQITIPITNHMMTLTIPQFEAVLYADEANEDLLATVSIDPASAILRTNEEALLQISIDLIKSQALEDWLNGILSTFVIQGFLSLNVSIGAFGCVVGPISVTNLSLAALGLDADMLTGLLEAVNPMNPEKGNPLQVLGNNPNAAQLDIMSLIGKFGLAWVEISPARWDSGAWDRNEQFPMINVSLGIALQPAFNMSIDTADHNPASSDLQLCDSKIFKAIYDLPNDAPVDETLWNTAVKYSKVADLFIRNTPIYFNNTYDGSKDQIKNYKIDPHKPYFLNNTDLTRAATCQPSYDEDKALGDYTWDFSTDSYHQVIYHSWGMAPVFSPLGYRKEAYFARAIQLGSGAYVDLKPTTNLSGFWSVTFMARSVGSSGSAMIFFQDSAGNDRGVLPFDLTSEWKKFTFVLPNFTVSMEQPINWDLANRMYFWTDGQIYLDDLSITAPQVSSYTSWGDEGVLDNDPEMVKDSTFNLIEFNLLMYNTSHPSFAEAYPRALWRKLGGPYFTPIVYGREYGGFPDHRVVYPSYFSPYANFLGGMVSLLGPALSGGDIASVIPALISSIALNGSLSVNVFSMDLKINVGLPILGDLLASMGTLLATALYRVMYRATNPLSTESPFTAQFDNLLGGLGSFPIIGLFYEIPIFGATERNNHIFAPQHNSGTGTNVNPFNWYYRDPYEYVPGLVTPENPNAMNTENFFHDDYYDDFKVYVENWANSIGIDNPYFESKHPLLDRNHFTDEERTYKEGVFDLRNPDSWALKYNGNRYGGTGRVRTNVLNFLLGVSLPLAVEVLGAYIYFLFDSPYQPCQYAPGGYIWINESLYMPQGPGWKQADGSDYVPYLYPWRNKTSTPSAIWNGPNGPQVETGRDPRFSLYPSAGDPHPVHFDANGKVTGSQRQAAPYADGGFTDGQVGNWMFMNIRLFEGGPVSDFLNTLINSLMGIISGVATVVSANASLFGYEVYNIGGLSLPLGDHSPSGVAFCDQYAGGAANGSAWNMPAANGTYLPPEPKAPTWPPALPGFTPTYYMEDTMYLSMDDLFGDLLTMIVNLLVENLLDDINQLISNILTVILTGTLPFHINSFTINNPIPLPMWIRNIGIDIDIIINDMTIRLGVYKSDDIWTEFDTYPGQTHNPYDFSANPLAAIAVYEPVTIPAIDIEINIPGGIIDLIGELLGGGLSLNIAINDILLYIAIPAEWDYFFTLSAASMLGDMVDLSSLGL